MKNTIMTAAVLAAATAFAAPATASTMNLLTNGSFEMDPGDANPGLQGDTFGSLQGSTGGGSWDIFTSLPGWTGDIGPGIEIQTDNTLNFIDAQDGDHYVELDSTSNSGMSQTLFLDAGDYLLSFWFAPRTNNDASNGISFGVNEGSSGFGNVVNFGAVEGPNGDYPTGTWTEVLMAFTIATDGDYSLFFDATGTSDSLGGLIDNVSISAVPLPASSLLLLAGLGGLAAMRRRKTA